MKIETRVNLKNGQSIIIDGVPDYFDKNFFEKLKTTQANNSDVVVYGSNGQIPLKVNEIRSIEFVIN
ncbi:hypothetical protein [Bhargavaea changchunensis]|uniref:hypothetical protein n=1 Tax=Bhargavaea changchunensis TaxID=2134037 RepID=UPI0012F8C3A7